jgi:hypothetical protein
VTVVNTLDGEATPSPTKLAIIVPTIGRQTLVRTLSSFAPDLQEDDHVYIVHTDLVTGTESIDVAYLSQEHKRYSLATWTYIPFNDGGCWGHNSRNHVLDQQPDADYIWTIDDDDIAVPGTLGQLRRQTAPWAIYRMHFGDNHPARTITCWREPILRHGDIGTPMILARPCNARFGQRYEGDWDYTQALQAELGEPVFDRTVIALIRPGDDQ